MDEVWEQMTDIAAKKLEHWESDFDEHDRQQYAVYPDKTPMVWAVRDTGTWLFPLKDTVVSKYGESFRHSALDMSSHNAEYYYLEKNRFMKKISLEEAHEYVKKGVKMTMDNFPKGKVINMDSQQFVSIGNRKFLHIHMSEGASVPLVAGVNGVTSDKMMEYYDSVNHVTTDEIQFYKYERMQLCNGRVIPKNPRSLTKNDQKKYDEAKDYTCFLRIVTPDKMYLYPEADIACGSGMAAFRNQQVHDAGSIYKDIKGIDMVELSGEEALEILKNSRAKALKQLPEGSLITAYEQYPVERTVYALKTKDGLCLLEKEEDTYKIKSDLDYHGLDDIYHAKSKKYFSKKDMEMLLEGKSVVKRLAKTIVVEKAEGQVKKR